MWGHAMLTPTCWFSVPKTVPTTRNHYPIEILFTHIPFHQSRRGHSWTHIQSEHGQLLNAVRLASVFEGFSFRVQRVRWTRRRPRAVARPARAPLRASSVLLGDSLLEGLAVGSAGAGPKVRVDRVKPKRKKAATMLPLLKNMCHFPLLVLIGNLSYWICVFPRGLYKQMEVCLN